MRRKSRWFGCPLALGAILFAVIVSGAQQPDSSNAVPVTTVVTVLGPKFSPPPAVSKDDILVREGQVRKDVADWVPAQGDKAGLELAILIDDADLRRSDEFHQVAAQVHQRRHFLRQQQHDFRRLANHPRS